MVAFALAIVGALVVIGAQGPSGAATTAVTGSSTINLVNPLALTGSADSQLRTDGTFTTVLSLDPGTAVQGPTGPCCDPTASTVPEGFTFTYAWSQTGGGTGMVDPVGGTASFDVRLTFGVTGDPTDPEMPVFAGPYRFVLDLHLAGSYDSATGRVALVADPFAIPPTADCGRRTSLDGCAPGEDDFNVQVLDMAVAGNPSPALSLAFTLPEPSDATTTTTSSTTLAGASTTTMAGTTLPVPTVPTVLTVPAVPTTGASSSTTTTTTVERPTAPATSGSSRPNATVPGTESGTGPSATVAGIAGTAGSTGSTIGAGGLARTGSSLPGPAVLGLGLIAIGGLAVLAERRSRRRLP